MLSNFPLQSMDALKRSLIDYGIAFTEKVFTAGTNETVDSLMPEPFVSKEFNDAVLLTMTL